MKTVAAFVFCIACSANALAGDFRFDYSPQNLGDPQGVARLHEKLEIAVNRYCRDQFITLNTREAQKCSASLMEKSIRQIGNARLAEYGSDEVPHSS